MLLDRRRKATEETEFTKEAQGEGEEKTADGVRMEWE